MSLVNSRLSTVTGTVTATLVIHAVGLLVVSIIVAARRETSVPGRVPLHFLLGGVVGVGTVFTTVWSFNALGASLAVALALLGQTLYALVVDATGFLGHSVTPFSARRLPGLLLAVAGVVVIAGEWRSAVPALAIGLVSGVLPGLSFSLNAELGRRRGIFRATFVNYVTGLATTAVIALVVRPSLAPAIHAVAAAGPVLALGGGILGVAVVATMSFLFPRIPAFTATLLLFSGQALSGVAIDAVTAGSLDVRKLVGTLVLLGGLGLDRALAKRGDARHAVRGSVDRAA